MKQSVQTIGWYYYVKSFLGNYPTTIHIIIILPSTYFIGNALDDDLELLAIPIVLLWELLKAFSIFITTKNTMLEYDHLRFIISAVANTCLALASILAATAGLLSFISVSANLKCLSTTFFGYVLNTCKRGHR